MRTYVKHQGVSYSFYREMQIPLLKGIYIFHWFIEVSFQTCRKIKWHGLMKQIVEQIILYYDCIKMVILNNLNIMMQIKWMCVNH